MENKILTFTQKAQNYAEHMAHRDIEKKIIVEGAVGIQKLNTWLQKHLKMFYPKLCNGNLNPYKVAQIIGVIFNTDDIDADPTPRHPDEKCCLDYNEEATHYVYAYLPTSSDDHAIQFMVICENGRYPYISSELSIDCSDNNYDLTFFMDEICATWRIN